MTLFHLLLGICFLMPFGAALDVAKVGKAGPVGYILAFAIALVMGFVFAWILYTSGKMLWKKTMHRSSSLKELYAVGLYFVAVIWIVFSDVAAHWVLSFALHAVV
jgi:hypothetical protein